MLYQAFPTLSSCNGTSRRRYVKSVCLQKLHNNGITSIVASNRQIGMEGIGRLRKIKSNAVEGVEKIVEKSKEKLESKKENEPNEDKTGSRPSSALKNVKEQAGVEEYVKVVEF